MHNIDPKLSYCMFSYIRLANFSLWMGVLAVSSKWCILLSGNVSLLNVNIFFNDKSRSPWINPLGSRCMYIYHVYTPNGTCTWTHTLLFLHAKVGLSVRVSLHSAFCDFTQVDVNQWSIIKGNVRCIEDCSPIVLVMSVFKINVNLFAFWSFLTLISGQQYTRVSLTSQPLQRM